MNDSNRRVFENNPAGLSLIDNPVYLGLTRSSSPEMAERVRLLFDHLNGKLSFANNPQGKEDQKCFNCLLRYVYPELMIDLADIIYVQHERPMVFLNLEHINFNLQSDPQAKYQPSPTLDTRMEFLFRRLTDTIRQDEMFFNDPTVVRLLAESYSYYIFQTKNFPWEETVPDSQIVGGGAVLDVATGLTGYSLAHDWPENFPRLILTDKMPFILESLRHYQSLLGRQNIEIVRADFPGTQPSQPLGSIWANKFLHHLQREERQQFLRWAWDCLEPKGVFNIVDADLENRILHRARDSVYRSKLIPNYLGTLVEIEEGFSENLVQDVRQAGFKMLHFDSHEYRDETDAYSMHVGDNIDLQFTGFEIFGEK
ncbi:MAG: class I SAM-dependent methyltransferase [Nitrospinota bacterium]|nr:class I SAM-dependent methyltransferase [Nitrospinota bacterium]